MNGRNLGFGSKLAQIKPDNTPEPAIPMERVDEIADRHGFGSREPVRKITRKKEAEPSANLNIRPSVPIFNRFVQFAMDNRMSYPEALKEIMDRAGID